MFILLLVFYPEQDFTIFITIFSLIPTIALVYVTWMYVKITYDILQENQLLGKKNFFIEMINKFFFSILRSLKKEIEDINKK